MNALGRERTRLRRLALGGAVGPALFASVVTVCAALRPDYGHLTDFISQLGATGTVHAGWMNHAGFVPSGLLLAGFAISLASLLADDRPALLGAALLVVFGAGVAAAGVFSCDPGCPQSGGSCENTIHERIGPISFLAAIAGTGLLGLRFRRLPAWRPLWLFSLVACALAAVFLALLVRSLPTRELTGLWQRGMLTMLFLWCAVVGVYAFRLGDGGTPGSAGNSSGGASDR